MEFTGRARSIFVITFATLALFLAVGLFAMAPGDWPFAHGTSPRDVGNPTGPFGSLLAWCAVTLFGRFFGWLLPLSFIAIAINAGGGPGVTRRWALKGLGAAVLFGALFSINPLTRNADVLYGRLGVLLGDGLSTVFGEIGTAIVLVALILLIGVGELGSLGSGAWRGLRSALNPALLLRPLRAAWAGMVQRMTLYRELLAERFATHDDEAEWAAAESGEDAVGDVDAKAPVAPPEINAPPAAASASAGRWEDPAAAIRPRRDEAPMQITEAATTTRRMPGKGGARLLKSGEKLVPLKRATLPSLDMLDRGGPEVATYSRDELKNWSGVLEEKLNQFGVQGRVSAVHHGPVVTTFEFEPAPGVRIKDITSRADDLALAMRARSLRMIAPIPGRAAVGIEIPNPESRVVYLYDVLNEITEKQRSRGVMIGLGVDVVGKPYSMNICNAPHLLIAGTTGSGKSVCLNGILASILFQYRPTDVRLLLVDPKIVEFSVYNGIPHLLHPVITDPKEAARSLEYMAGEMTRRNELFRRHGVRNIESYNAKVAIGGKTIADGEPMERLPYIVIVIDELGDLALAKGYDIETLLARLAQMARAAGIHMVLATQRPSVDVIVGRTKANFPTRIAFRVASKVDSRTILDTMGADKLLGRGDMLYMDTSNPTPVRLHGAWLSERELEQLINHWKAYEFDEDNLDLTSGRTGVVDGDDEYDPLFEDAKSVVCQFKQGSTSLLQRRLHVGYSRAARILDQLEQAGIVGPPEGSKPREVYVDSAGDGA